MSTFLRSIIALSLFLTFSAFDQPAMAAEQKAVLVTGASTGIGREIAETLARDGYFVYAGATTHSAKHIDPDAHDEQEGNHP